MRLSALFRASPLLPCPSLRFQWPITAAPSASLHMDQALPIALALLIAAAAAAALAWLLRGAGIAGGRPAAALVGGLLAGILLGPAVFGHVAPGAFERLYRGGVAERLALRQTNARHRAELAAASITGPAPGALAEVFARHNAERAPLERALNQAVAAHRRRLTAAGAGLLALTLLLAAWASRPPRFESRAVILAPLAVAGEIALIGGIAWYFLDADPWVALAIALPGAAGSIFAGLPLRWVPARGRTPPALAAAAATYLLAMALLLAVAPAQGRPIAAALLLAPVLGWTLRRAAPALRPSRRLARGALLWIALPTAVAVAALHIEWGILGDDTRILLAIPLLMFLSGNGAFAGFAAAWHAASPPLTNPAPVETILDWLAGGYNATQACATLAILAAGAADPATPLGSAAVAALLLSAALGETTLTSLRTTLAQFPEAHRFEPPMD